MKSFITCFILAIFIVYCQADGPDGPNGCPFLRGISKEDFKKCLDEVGLTKDELKALHESAATEPSAKELCLSKCLAINAGYIDKDGLIVSDLVKKNFPPDADDATIKTTLACLVAAGKVSTCDDMGKMMKCLPKPPNKTK